MWRSFLGLAAFLLLLSACRSTTTCDPTVNPFKADCPKTASTCDPAGICRNDTCSQGTCGAGEQCDQSVASIGPNAGAQICQTACETDAECPRVDGVPQVCMRFDLPGSTTTESFTIKVCKRKCSQSTEPWCNEPFQCRSVFQAGGPEPLLCVAILKCSDGKDPVLPSGKSQYTCSST